MADNAAMNETLRKGFGRAPAKEEPKTTGVEDVKKMAVTDIIGEIDIISTRLDECTTELAARAEKAVEVSAVDEERA